MQKLENNLIRACFKQYLPVNYEEGLIDIIRTMWLGESPTMTYKRPGNGELARVFYDSEHRLHHMYEPALKTWAGAEWHIHGKRYRKDGPAVLLGYPRLTSVLGWYDVNGRHLCECRMAQSPTRLKNGHIHRRYTIPPCICPDGGKFHQLHHAQYMMDLREEMDTIW